MDFRVEEAQGFRENQEFRECGDFGKFRVFRKCTSAFCPSHPFVDDCAWDFPVALNPEPPQLCGWRSRLTRSASLCWGTATWIRRRRRPTRVDERVRTSCA